VAQADEARYEYAGEYHRMVVTGLVDHQWVARLQDAVTGASSESVGEVLGQRGFDTSPELETALRELDWAAVRAVAQAFAPYEQTPERIA
jgi:hypothetical protein